MGVCSLQLHLWLSDDAAIAGHAPGGADRASHQRGLLSLRAARFTVPPARRYEPPPRCTAEGRAERGVGACSRPSCNGAWPGDDVAMARLHPSLYCGRVLIFTSVLAHCPKPVP